MFGRKPAPQRKPLLEVVGVSPLKKGDVVLEEHYYGDGKRTLMAPATTVLYTLDGVLKTKRFEGVWTLEQVKRWKEI